MERYHTASYALMPPLVFLPYELLVEEKGMITMYLYSVLFIRLNAKLFGIRSWAPLGRLFGCETASDLWGRSP